MNNHYVRLTKTLLPSFIAALPAIRDAATADCDKNANNDFGFSRRKINLSTCQILSENISTNRAFIIPSLKEPYCQADSLYRIRCKEQEFAHHQMHELIVGSIYHRINPNSPRMNFLLTVKNSQENYSVPTARRYACSELLKANNLETFIDSGHFLRLNKSQKITLLSSLASWIRLDIAMGKHIHLPNYLVLLKGDNVDVVSVDHESIGEFLHQAPFSPVPSAQYCLSMLLDKISDSDAQLIYTKAFNDELLNKTQKMFNCFVSINDFNALYDTIASQGIYENCEKDFNNTVAYIQLSQEKVKRWLRQLN